MNREEVKGGFKQGERGLRVVKPDREYGKVLSRYK
jgi:hypothetical protein